MADYIRRETAVKVLMRIAAQVSDSRRRAAAKCINEIELLPAANVEPVRHGQWVNNGIPDSILSGCSACGFSCGASPFHYCPNCGAKMDGGANV